MAKPKNHTFTFEYNCRGNNYKTLKENYLIKKKVTHKIIFKVKFKKHT